jgi:hypothetical protein
MQWKRVTKATSELLCTRPASKADNANRNLRLLEISNVNNDTVCSRVNEERLNSGEKGVLFMCQTPFSPDR